MNLEEIKKEYAEQDNGSTAYPIYVQVQEKHCVGVIKEGYSPICPFGDAETDIETNDDGDELTVGYIWMPVEFFLTIKGAEEYMKANKHNHGELRTYVSHFERRNYEMNNLLNELDFKVK